MSPRELVIRCYAEKKNSLWVAVCVDLPIAAQAEELNDAIENLNAQIEDYVLEALSEHQYTDQILKRKAPLEHRVKFYLHNLHFLKNNFARSFKAIMPLKPVKNPNLGLCNNAA